MAVLTGWLSPSPLGGLVNAALTTALQALAVDYWPVHVAEVSRLPNVVMATAWPVTTTPRAMQGRVAQAFSDDWYHRVHVRPNPVVLGNVLQDQVTAVEVWNAHLEPLWVLRVDGLQEGLALTGPSATPLAMGALQAQSWQLSVTRAGPGSIDQLLTWVFDGKPAASLRVTGNRVVAWPFVPDWTDGVTERLAWLTDIMASSSAAEQRRALRVAPRRSFETRTLVEGRERAMLDLAMAGWGSRVWALPVWPDAQQLAATVPVGSTSVVCSTVGRDFRAGGLAVMVGASATDVEAVEVATVAAGGITLARPTQQAWVAGARLYPARTAELAQAPALTRLTDRLSVVNTAWRMVEPCDWPAAALPLYRGLPVYTARPDETEDLTATWARLLLVLDPSVGVAATTDTAGSGFAVQGHRWALYGRSEQAAWRSLAYLLRGRLGAVWLPTHADDLTLVAVSAAGSTSMDVQAVGYTRFAVGRPGRRDVRIELSDGTALHRRVVSAAELGNGVERLALDAAPGVALYPSGTGAVSVLRISYLQCMRLDHDDIEIMHRTDADGLASVACTFRGLRDDLEVVA